MSESPSMPERIYKLLEGRSEALAAIDEILTASRNEVCVFDMHVRGLVERGFSSPHTHDVLRAMLLANRSHRVRIVLHDIQGFESALPRLSQLLAQFAGQIQIHRTVGIAREAADPLVLGDDLHFWHKLHVDHPRSVLTLNDGQDCRPWRERFDEIWEESELALSGTTLGL